MKRNAFFRIFALLLGLSLLAASLGGAAAENTRTGGYKRSRIIVSLGDSYASGEGIEPFYGQNNPIQVKADDNDWLAHRSMKAWSGMLTLPTVDGPMSEHRGTNWYFVASSGATTEHIRQSGPGTTGMQRKDFERDGYQGYKYLPGQLDVFYNTEGLDRYDVDYVTLSVGGNDVHFSEIIKQAHHTILSSEMFDLIDEQLDSFYDTGGTRDKLYAAYHRVAEAAPNATIIVVGYPELLDYSGKGLFFHKTEAEYINTAVRIFNLYIQKLVGECRQEGMKIEFVSVEEAFRGHQAYSDDNYINEVYYLCKDQDLKGFPEASAYSMHPNEKGARAYARCVQAKIDELEAEKAKNMPQRETSDVRNVVLVLDNSGSMEGTRIRETRKAGKDFVGTVLKEDASISIVTFSDNARLRSDFSMDEGYLRDIIDDIYTEDMTNTGAGLAKAREQLTGTGSGKKIVVLMSDGLANEGKTGSSLYEYAQELRDEGLIIYTIGFFQGLYGADLRSAQETMEKIASPGCHYEADKADNLVFFFGDIADQINGQPYIYIRIACPVDVEVRRNGEVLSSVTESTRTSFGSLTYEAGDGSGRDNRTKILRLRDDGTDYQISIRGNGTGTMHYTAGFTDRNGEYTDMREIEDVAITSSTLIAANAQRGSATVLRVDENGDGRVDRTYTAGGPGASAWLIIGIILGVLALFGAAAFLILRYARGASAAPEAAPADPAASVSSQYATTIPVTEAAPDGNHCPKCGTELKNSWKFCGVCGAALPSAEPNEPAAEPVEPAEPVAEPAVRVCSQCGAEMSGKALFCKRCGKRL